MFCYLGGVRSPWHWKYFQFKIQDNWTISEADMRVKGWLVSHKNYAITVLVKDRAEKFLNPSLLGNSSLISNYPCFPNVPTLRVLK